MTSTLATMPRDFHAEILAAHKAGDADTLARLALELAERAAVAERLTSLEQERKTHHAEWKRNYRRQRPRMSMDVHGHGSSPLVSPSPLPAPNPSSPLNLPFSVADAGQNAPPAPRRASWLVEIAPSWDAKFGAGTFPWGKAGRVLKPLHEAGHPPPEIAKRLSTYLAKTDPQFVSLHRFAETFDAHGPSLFTVPPVDEWGCMSDEFERMTRPPGYLPWTPKVVA